MDQNSSVSEAADMVCRVGVTLQERDGRCYFVTTSRSATPGAAEAFSNTSTEFPFPLLNRGLNNIRRQRKPVVYVEWGTKF
jgi:hypothetical protein